MGGAADGGRVTTPAARPHTWIRWAAAKLPWDDELFAAAWMVLAGLVPDAAQEIGRQVARMLVPVDGTHPETLPHLLRLHGLPAYLVEDWTTGDGYRATLARLRDAMLTHAVAGAKAQLDAELVRAGIPDGQWFGVGDGGEVELELTGYDPPIDFDGGDTFDSGATFDAVLTPEQSQGLGALVRYFLPARSLFRRIVLVA